MSTQIDEMRLLAENTNIKMFVCSAEHTNIEEEHTNIAVEHTNIKQVKMGVNDVNAN